MRIEGFGFTPRTVIFFGLPPTEKPDEEEIVLQVLPESVSEVSIVAADGGIELVQAEHGKLVIRVPSPDASSAGAEA